MLSAHEAWMTFAAGALALRESAAMAGWQMLQRMYASRPYHNLHHVQSMVGRLRATAFDGLSPHSANIIEAAIWFHDCVYDVYSAKGLNELQSAELARIFLLGAAARVDEAFIDGVQGCILATQHVAAPTGTAERIIVDLDLFELASERSQYIQNSRNIRAEFAHVDEPSWWKGRAAFLAGMLARERIFHTAQCTPHEDAARQNMQAESDYLHARMRAGGSLA